MVRERRGVDVTCPSGADDAGRMCGVCARSPRRRRLAAALGRSGRVGRLAHAHDHAYEQPDSHGDEHLDPHAYAYPNRHRHVACAHADGYADRESDDVDQDVDTDRDRNAQLDGKLLVDGHRNRDRRFDGDGHRDNAPQVPWKL